jgi:hypothetical protein
LFKLVFLGELKLTSVKEKGPVMVMSVMALAVLSLLGGIFIQFPNGMVQAVISQIFPGGLK